MTRNLTANTMLDLGLDPGRKRGHSGQTVKI